MEPTRLRLARRAHDADVVIRLLLLGDGAVGKSSLLLRYCDDKFDPRHVITIGVDFKSKVVNVGEERVRLQVWDTAGQERFRNITPVCFRSAMGVVLVFDVSNIESFENVNYWLESLQNHAGPNLYKVLVGNKVDIIRRQVSRKRAESLASKHHIEYLETSALENTGVNELFSHVATKIRQQQIEDITGQARRNRGTSMVSGYHPGHHGPFKLEDDLPGVEDEMSELNMLSCCGLTVKKKMPKKTSSASTMTASPGSPQMSSPSFSPYERQYTVAASRVGQNPPYGSTRRPNVQEMKSRIGRLPTHFDSPEQDPVSRDDSGALQRTQTRPSMDATHTSQHVQIGEFETHDVSRDLEGQVLLRRAPSSRKSKELLVPQAAHSPSGVAFNMPSDENQPDPMGSQLLSSREDNGQIPTSRKDPVRLRKSKSRMRSVDQTPIPPGIEETPAAQVSSVVMPDPVVNVTTSAASPVAPSPGVRLEKRKTTRPRRPAEPSLVDAGQSPAS